MKVFIRTHRLLPLATLVLLAVLVAVSLVSPLVQVQWGGTIGGRALASGTWTIQGSGVTPNSLNGIACPSASNCFAVGAIGTILNTTNWGNIWNPPPSPGSGTTNSLNGIACPSASYCFAVGAKGGGQSKGTIVATINGGSTWGTQNSGVAQNLNGIACLSTTNCFAVGASGTILNTTNGTSWSALTNGGSNWTSQNLNGIACPGASPITCFAVGASGTILNTINGGTNWNPQTSGVSNNLLGIACPGTSPITCYVVGAGGTILNTTNGGTNWNPQTSGVSNNLLGIACQSTTTCFAVGAGGTILTLASGTWTSQTVGTADLLGIACPSATTCFAVGASGTILFSTTGSLTESGTTTSATPVTLNGANNTTTYALGLTVTDNRQNGAGWNITFSSTAFSCATCKQGGQYSFSTASTINIQSVVCNNGASGTCTSPTTSGITYPLTISQGTTTKFFNAAAGTGTTTGTGSITITPTVTITIPANAFHGTYSSTLTIAIASGP
jgi:photosystem II stability/assembly factor-like uncharacterized protein